MGVICFHLFGNNLLI